MKKVDVITRVILPIVLCLSMYACSNEYTASTPVSISDKTTSPLETDTTAMSQEAESATSSQSSEESTEEVEENQLIKTYERWDGDYESDGLLDERISYDQQGRIVCDEFFDENGECFRREENEYSDSKNLHTIWTKEIGIIEKTENEYDDAGNIIHQNSYKIVANKVTEGETFWAYTNGRLTERSAYENGELLEKTIFEYTADGLESKKNTTNKSGGVEEYRTEYNSNGDVTTYIISMITNAGMEITKTHKYEYDSSGRKVKELFTEENSLGLGQTATTTYYEYDSDGRVVKETNTDGSGQTTYTCYDFEFDSEGRMIARTITYKDKQGERVCRYLYSAFSTPEGNTVEYTHMYENNVFKYFNAKIVNRDGILIATQESDNQENIIKLHVYDASGEILSMPGTIDSKLSQIGFNSIGFINSGIWEPFRYSVAMPFEFSYNDDNTIKKIRYVYAFNSNTLETYETTKSYRYEYWD